MADNDRAMRAKQRAILKRDAVCNRIRQIHNLSVRAVSDPVSMQRLVIASGDLDGLWDNFLAENDAVLDTLMDLDQLGDFCQELELNMRALVYEVKATVDNPVVTDATGSIPGDGHSAVVSHVGETESVKSTQAGKSSDAPDACAPCSEGASSTSTSLKFNNSRLPDIPLPTFDGDLLHWPVFRDRFISLVANRTNLSNVEKFYYLLGCLEADPREVLKGITVSNDTYELAWNALKDRFDKPRKLASSIVDKLLLAPVAQTESLTALNEFIKAFDESVALLEALAIPNLSSFLLFSIASKCLPLSSRKLFETENTNEYPTFNCLIKFVKSRVHVLENSGVTPAITSRKSVAGPFRKPVSQKETQRVFVASNMSDDKPSSTNSVNCPCCSNTHQLKGCPKFKALSVDGRYNVVCTHRLCMVCFSNKHMSFKCPSSCSICSRRHHALLHRETSSTSASKDGPAQVALFGGCSTPTVLLGTALVQVLDVGGSCQIVRALIDSASQISAITSSCCARLGFRPSRWTLPVTGLSGQSVPDVKGAVLLQIQPREIQSPLLSTQVWVLSKITSDMPAHQLPRQIRAKCKHLQLADPQFDIPAPVELLLGADVFPQVWGNQGVSLGDKYPTAYSSVFGWVLIGPVHQELDVSAQVMSISTTPSLEFLMERFWNIEEPEAAPLQFTEEGQCEALFQSEMSRDSQGRFTVPLPVRNECSNKSFPGTRQVALNRFYQLERKLARDPKLWAAYRQFMDEYEELGHMTRSEDPGDYFIPHHPVLKTIGENMKLRVVFDASARCHSGVSLNDCLHVGPKLQQDIVDVLSGFRVHPVAFTTDICKMYRQIKVHSKYLGYQRILWRAFPQEQVKEYTLNTVTYGVNCAPYLALRVLRHIADTDCSDTPDISAALRHQTYMDDICIGAESLESAKALKKNIIDTLARSGLTLKKWASNSPDLLADLPADDCVGGQLAFERGDEIPVLGLRWVPETDCFTYDVSSFQLVLSKRGILSMIARIFDPLGFLAPTLFYAKCIMQRLWNAQISWDDQLPPDIKDEWFQFYSSSSWLSSVRVPRYVGASPECRYHLCGFCDASEMGYAAVVYLRVTNPDGEVGVYLLGAKTKLAPMKKSTVPRLELCGAVLLTQWMSRLRRILENHLRIVSVFAWSDSTIVLSWLSTPHTSFKQFVSNRVHQIQTTIPECRWAHVRTEENPADCASRGLRPPELLQCLLYWKGPEFLKAPLEDWNFDLTPVPSEQLPEVKPVSLVLTGFNNKLEWYNRFSSYDRMLRVIARMRRFIAKCRRQRVNHDFLTRGELDGALFSVVRYAQNCYFSHVLHELLTGKLVTPKPIARLCPFIDPEGIIRVGGRLRNARCSEDRKHPILISKESHLAILIARHWHRSMDHARTRLLIALIHRRFWIPGVRSIVHKTLTSCTVCVKLAALNPQPLMADLPISRVQESRVFSCIGIDYAGPLSMKETCLRKARQYKVYIALFICMSTKAVHLELVLSLSTEAFLAALDRFVARRGLPTSIHSDCGTNFVGAAKQLRKLVNEPSNRDQLTGHVACSWNFNPPSAPHFGGVWEAAVKSMKSLLVRSMGSQTWTLEEFSTILCRVEAALNSRPLTPLSYDPNDLECLTPGHFLIGQPLLSVPEAEVPVGRVNLRNRWKLLQQVFQSFWRRWSNEYLNTLQARGRWSSIQDNVQLDAMVVVKDQGPPLSWRLGRIVELLPGADGTVRVVKVLTALGTITRPVVKIVLLPTE